MLPSLHRSLFWIRAGSYWILLLTNFWRILIAFSRWRKKSFRLDISNEIGIYYYLLYLLFVQSGFESVRRPTSVFSKPLNVIKTWKITYCDSVVPGLAEAQTSIPHYNGNLCARVITHQSPPWNMAEHIQKNSQNRNTERIRIYFVLTPNSVAKLQNVQSPHCKKQDNTATQPESNPQ